MKRFSFIVLSILLLALSGCVADPIAPETAPWVDLSYYVETSRNSAVLSAELFNSVEGLVEYGFFIGETSDLSVNYKKHIAEFDVRYRFPRFESKITGLEPGKTYYYKAYVSDGIKMAFSRTSSFTTPAEETPIISDVCIEGNILKARIIDDGGRSIKHAGFCWSTDENPDVLDLSANAVIDPESNICMEIPEIDSDKDYYFRAFADNGMEGRNAVAYSSNQIRYRSGEPAIFEVESDVIVLTDAAEEFRIVVKANVGFTIGEPSADWIHKSDIMSPKINTFDFYADRNDDGNAREAEITITAPALGKVCTVRVRQVGTDVIKFEDPEFESYIISAYDTNGDGKISQSEALEVYFINIHTKNIMSLAGIEYFPNLEYLYCDPLNYHSGEDYYPIKGNLTELNLSNFPKLRVLSCINNKLTSLNFENCNSLERVFLDNNQLEHVQLPRLTHIVALTCDNNNLKTLELKDCPNLIKLRANNNKFERLDLDDCSGLRNLSVNGNNLTSLNVDNSKGLTCILCNQNNISDLNLSNQKSLTEIECGYNKITSIDVSNNQNLTYLSCNNNELESVNVMGCISLRTFTCQGNQLLKSLDISTSKKIYYLDCDYCPQLDTLYLPAGFSPEYLYCGSNTKTLYK